MDMYAMLVAEGDCVIWPGLFEDAVKRVTHKTIDEWGSVHFTYAGEELDEVSIRPQQLLRVVKRGAQL